VATVSESIEQWRNKQISGVSLMRVLVSRPDWSVPVSESAVADMLAQNNASRIQFSRNKEGKNCLLLFSTGDAYDVYRQALAIPGTQHFLQTTGTWVFRLPLDEIDQIWIDPLTKHDIYYEKEQFARLSEIARAVLVEEALVNLRTGTAQDGAIRLVRDYQGYSVAVTLHEGRPRMLMAPDSKQRALAAIFTADDAYDAFAPEAKTQAGDVPVQQLRLPGEAMFNALQKMKLDGIVFNCAGPVTPVAFAAAFMRVVLGA
jgi:hypothetical protein